MRLSLVDPRVSTPTAVRGLDNEEVFLDDQELVAVHRSRRDSVQGVARVVVKQDIVFYRPASGEFRDELPMVDHFAAECAIVLENVMTALDFVRVTPLPCQLSFRARLHDRARRHQGEAKDKNNFHAGEGEHDHRPARQAQSRSSDAHSRRAPRLSSGPARVQQKTRPSWITCRPKTTRAASPGAPLSEKFVTEVSSKRQASKRRGISYSPRRRKEVDNFSFRLVPQCRRSS